MEVFQANVWTLIIFSEMRGQQLMSHPGWHHSNFWVKLWVISQVAGRYLIGTLMLLPSWLTILDSNLCRCRVADTWISNYESSARWLEDTWLELWCSSPSWQVSRRSLIQICRYRCRCLKMRRSLIQICRYRCLKINHADTRISNYESWC